MDAAFARLYVEEHVAAFLNSTQRRTVESHRPEVAVVCDPRLYLARELSIPDVFAAARRRDTVFTIAGFPRSTRLPAAGAGGAPGGFDYRGGFYIAHVDAAALARGSSSSSLRAPNWRRRYHIARHTLLFLVSGATQIVFDVFTRAPLIFKLQRRRPSPRHFHPSPPRLKTPGSRRCRDTRATPTGRMRSAIMPITAVLCASRFAKVRRDRQREMIPSQFAQ